MNKTERTWNANYQKLLDMAKSITTEDECLKFYDETQPLYLKADVSGIRLRSSLLQTRSRASCPRDKAPHNNILRPITFASKSLSSVEIRYSNIEREALGKLHRLEKFNHYYFMREVSIITDHKLLEAIFKKDVAMLS